MYIHIYDILQKKQTTGIKTDQWLSRVMGGQERVIKNRQHDRILGDDGLFGVLIVVAITQFYANIKPIELYTKNYKVYINF